MTAVTARPADSFVDGVGINIHSHYTDTAYASMTHVISLLQGLGIRHVRDGWANTENPDGTPNGDTATASAWRALHAAGIGVTDLVGAPLRGVPWSVSTSDARQRIDEVAGLLTQNPGVLDALEGPNEWDQSGDLSWQASDLAYQQLVVADARSDAATAHVPVIAPSLAQPTSTLPSLARIADQGNLHFYPADDRPEAAFAARLAASHNPLGSPTVTTEAGYTTGYVPGHALPPGTPPVDEAAQATYLPRLLAEGFRDGSARTFLYELLDTVPGSYGTTPTVPDDSNQHFGLVRADYTPKPGYGAVARLLGLLADPHAAPFTPAKLTFAVAAPTANDIRTVVLQRGDGTFQLLVWRGDTKVFQAGAQTPASVPVTIDLLNPVSRADAYTPTTGAHDVLTSTASTQLTLSLGANLAVVDLTPAPGPSISCAPSSYDNAVAADRPSLWLPLDEQSGAPRDVAGRGALVSSWSSAPTYRVPGAGGGVNGATGVSGSQQIVATLPAALGSGAGFTLEAWVEPSASTPAYSRFLTTDAGAWSVLMRTYGTTARGTLGSVYGSGGEIIYPGLTAGAWHHVTLVVAGASTLFYLDGRLAGQTSAGTATAIRRLKLGSVEANGFIGALAEVAVYPRALPAADIAAHYCLGRTSAAAGYAATVRSDAPVAFLRFGEKAGVPVDGAGQGATASAWSTPPTYGAPPPLAGDPTTSVRVAGSEHVTLSLPHPLTSAAGITLEAWVLADASTPDGSRFVSSDVGAFSVMMRTYAMAGPDPLASAYGGGGEIIYHGLLPGAWHQLDLVIGSTSSAIFVDGRWAANAANVSAVTLGKLTLGSQPTVGWDAFSGDLADLSVYATALSADRIAAHFAAATAVSQ